MKEFIDRWESLDSVSYKTIIRTKFFDNSNEFIWWDCRPVGMRPSYVRFSYQYTKPEQIVDGLDNLLTVYKFVTNQQEKKQKRNDDEGSNYRLS